MLNKKFSLSLFQKLFFLYTLIIICTLTISFLLFYNSIRDSYLNQEISSLKNHINYLANSNSLNDPNKLNLYSKYNKVRITIIENNGKVIFDSHANPLNMENHLNRVEVKQALENSYGIATRYSSTLRQTIIYVAKYTDNEIVRLSYPQKELIIQIKGTIKYILFLTLIILLASIIIIYKISKNITTPVKTLLNEMKIFADTHDIPAVSIQTHDEIGQLGDSFNQLTTKINEDIQKLKKLENMRKEFIANVSHELKTPLTSIQGYIETLDHGAIEDKATTERFINTIKNNVDRLSALVSDVLDLSRIENKTSETNILDIANVLNKSIMDNNLSNNPNISIELPAKPLFVEANAKELYSAIYNYIDNALKYAPNSKIHIELKKIDHSVRYSVTDQGPGIPSEHLPRLFERFYRPDQTRSRKNGGTGLGLAIVKNIVEKYGGSVGVNSEVGKGSTFYFHLPLTKN